MFFLKMKMKMEFIYQLFIGDKNKYFATLFNKVRIWD